MSNYMSTNPLYNYNSITMIRLSVVRDRVSKTIDTIQQYSYTS